MTRRAILFLGFAVSLFAQAPAPIEQHFQGRRGKLLVDMPGDDSGIEVLAGDAPARGGDPVEKRLSKYGVALRRGQVAAVTLVKVKGDHIEFQLDGGGFTNKQLLLMPGYDSSHWGTSEEERRLRYDISGTRDKKRKQRLESEYDRLRQRRVKPLRDQYEREQRERHGSRFNIRFVSDREASRVTPEELTALLSRYIDLR